MTAPSEVRRNRVKGLLIVTISSVWDFCCSNYWSIFCRNFIFWINSWRITIVEIKITQLIIFYGLPSPTTVETLTTIATVPTTTTLTASTGSTVSTIATVASATNSACNPSATGKSSSLMKSCYLRWAFRKSVPKIANPQFFFFDLQISANVAICYY